jgi:hypothetical protein
MRGALELICIWLLVLLAGATISQLIARAVLAIDERDKGVSREPGPLP